MEIRTIKVSNVSLGASEHDIKEFFSFSGEIDHVELQSDNERCQVAYVTFKDPQGADTAVLLSGSTIVDQTVTIDLALDFKPPAGISTTPKAAQNQNDGQPQAESAVQKAEDVVSSMLAKGFVLGKDALNKAKAFDESLGLTSTATATAASVDQKIGLSEKITAGTTIVNEKVREMDEKYQVSEKTKYAFAAAEQTVTTAGSAIMKNRYVLSGATWVTGAFNRVAKAAVEKAKEKALAEEELGNKSEGNAQINKSASPTAAATSEKLSESPPQLPKEN